MGWHSCLLAFLQQALSTLGHWCSMRGRIRLCGCTRCDGLASPRWRTDHPSENILEHWVPGTLPPFWLPVGLEETSGPFFLSFAFQARLYQIYSRDIICSLKSSSNPPNHFLKVFLNRGLQLFFYKGPESTYFGLCGPCCCSNSTMPLSHGLSHRQHITDEPGSVPRNLYLQTQMGQV